MFYILYKFTMLDISANSSTIEGDRITQLIWLKGKINNNKKAPSTAILLAEDFPQQRKLSTLLHSLLQLAHFRPCILYVHAASIG